VAAVNAVGTSAGSPASKPLTPASALAAGNTHSTITATYPAPAEGTATSTVTGHGHGSSPVAHHR
jgi:hypothetical protein